MKTKDLLADERATDKALARPLPLELARPEWDDVGVADFVVFTEPPKAPGIRAVLQHLRKGVKDAKKLDKGSERYSTLEGFGLHRENGTKPPTMFVEDGIQFQSIQYRLIACTHDLTPIGYCTFDLTLSHGSGRALEVNDVWAEPAWREQGIGSAFAQIVARIAATTLEEVDFRLAGGLRHIRSIPVLIEADVYSESGEDFLFSVGRALEYAADDVMWMSYAGLDIEVEPRW
ncbi:MULTISPECIES: hypothetical protein [Cupriavidus]|uniref:N-acetyltransferase domain-containing protein n=1 Tax=Cupriavidus taiwanensis TaxID=164546 RepID=A0A375JAY1_9BURK|nr:MULTISPECIES: hypothetical protein [Cupriavidus]SPS02247.1 hypothetical protein CBM2634_P20032 [Cupriavidus taiwanensis]